MLESDESPCPRDRFEVPAEYATLLANTAPSLPNGPSSDFQTYAQKKRANQRLKTGPSPSNSSTSTTRSQPQSRTRLQTVSEKAKGKKKEAPRAEPEDEDMD